MSGVFEPRELYLRALTPLHVGTGEELAPGFEILRSGERSYVLDLERVLAAPGTDADRLAAAFGAGARKPGDTLLEELRQAGVDPAQVSRHVFGAIWTRGRIRLQARTAGGRPLVPGSSLKGALRTLALAALLGSEAGGASERASARVRAALERIAAGRPPRAADSARREIEDPVLVPRWARARGIDGPRRDLLRLFHCSDAAFDEASLRITELSIPGNRDGGGLLGSPIGAEAIAEGARARVRVGFDAWLCDRGTGALWDAAPALSWQRLAEVSQTRARAIAQREARRFRELGLARAAERLDKLGFDGLHADALVFRLGFGIGWESTTGGLLDEAAREQVRNVRWRGSPTAKWSAKGFPASRKLVRAIWRRDGAGCWQAFVGVDLPLGWVVLEPVDGAAPAPRETRGEPRGDRAERGERGERGQDHAARGQAGDARGRDAGPRREGRRDERRTGRDERRPRRGEKPAPAKPVGPRVGDEVRAIVLEERTKKGALRFRLEGVEREAYLQPGGTPAPDDLAAGARVVLRVRAVPTSKGEAIACHWIRLADAPRS